MSGARLGAVTAVLGVHSSHSLEVISAIPKCHPLSHSCHRLSHGHLVLSRVTRALADMRQICGTHEADAGASSHASHESPVCLACSSMPRARRDKSEVFVL